jgi:hypothetical protein
MTIAPPLTPPAPAPLSSGDPAALTQVLGIVYRTISTRRAADVRNSYPPQRAHQET